MPGPRGPKLTVLLLEFKNPPGLQNGVCFSPKATALTRTHVSGQARVCRASRAARLSGLEVDLFLLGTRPHFPSISVSSIIFGPEGDSSFSRLTAGDSRTGESDVLGRLIGVAGLVVSPSRDVAQARAAHSLMRASAKGASTPLEISAVLRPPR